MTEYLESEASRAATSGAPIKKSGWQRLGVVISVLWAVGAPIYAMVDTNHRAGENYGHCYSIAYKTYGPGPTANETRLQIAEAECRRALDSAAMPPQKLLDVLLGKGSEPGGAAILWGIILVPIALLWLIGGTIIGTVRWVATGFRR